MSDFTIIIPHRGNALGLWATVHSCESELEGSAHNFNFVVVTNGGPLDPDTKNLLHYMGDTGRLLKHVHCDEALAPPAARQRGVDVADGELLFFFDNHCLVGKRYFDRAVADFAAKPIDALHSSTRFYNGQGTHYHYRLKLEYNFWAESSMVPYKEFVPYQLAAGGHGGFAVRRDVWDEVGGYGPGGLLQGYAGEEMIFDLKLWRYGKTVWIDPKLVHFHFAGERGYSRHGTDEYFTNLLASAHVIGGEKWLYKVYESFAGARKHLRVRPQASMYELLETAYLRSVDYAQEVNARSVRTLDESLDWFRRNDVATT